MTPPVPTRRRNPEAKHAALMHAAIAAFTEDGYAATSMSGIAKRAGMAVGTIYRFYPDKIGLLAALHDQVEAELINAMTSSWDEGGDYAARLDRMVGHLFDFFDNRRAVLSILSMTTDLVGRDGTLPADGIRDAIAGFLAEGIQAGDYVNEISPRLAALVHGAVEGTMLQFLMGRLPKDEAIASTRAFLKRAVLMD